MTGERLTKLLEHYRVSYDAGDKIALHEAVLFAAWNNLPVPQWAVPELEEIIQLHAEGKFRRGKGVPGPWKQSESRGRDNAMHAEVGRLLSLSDDTWRVWVGDIPKTLDSALSEVADSFTSAYRERPDRKVFTRAMVKAAYYRVEGESSKKGDSSGSDGPHNM